MTFASHVVNASTKSVGSLVTQAHLSIVLVSGGVQFILRVVFHAWYVFFLRAPDHLSYRPHTLFSVVRVRAVLLRFFWQLLVEFLLSRQLDEAAACVKELDCRLFHHEIVKRAVKVTTNGGVKLSCASKKYFPLYSTIRCVEPNVGEREREATLRVISNSSGSSVDDVALGASCAAASTEPPHDIFMCICVYMVCRGMCGYDRRLWTRQTTTARPCPHCSPTSTPTKWSAKDRARRDSTGCTR